MTDLSSRILAELHQFREDFDPELHEPAPPGVERMAALLQEAADAIDALTEALEDEGEPPRSLGGPPLRHLMTAIPTSGEPITYKKEEQPHE